jgi:hypothetical protein
MHELMQNASRLSSGGCALKALNSSRNVVNSASSAALATTPSILTPSSVLCRHDVKVDWPSWLTA